MKNLLLPIALLFSLSLPAKLQAQAILSIDPVYEGGTATFHLAGGSPHSTLHMCYSMVGPGPTTLNSGLVFNLSMPIRQLSPFQLDSTGAGQLGPLPIPNSITAGTLGWFQGVEDLGGGHSTAVITNMVSAIVEVNTGPEMVLVPGGSFFMGDHYFVGLANERPAHAIHLDDFYIDVYELTFSNYGDYLNSAHTQGAVTVSNNEIHQVGGAAEALADTNASDSSSMILWDGTTFSVITGFENRPMIRLSWFGACHYANWRSREDGLTPCYDETSWDCDFTADGYRLPTEAEWEYAARGGAHNPYFQYPWNRNDIHNGDANYNYPGAPCDVGSYPHNGYGLYDTSGNVLEWCNDWYDSNYYSNSSSANPTGPTSGVDRVIRGGSWADSALQLRSARRSYFGPVGRNHAVGVRLLASRP